MYYISSKNSEGLFGVTDTSDDIEGFYRKEDLLKLVSKQGIEIDGVCLKDKSVCIVKKDCDTHKLFKQGKYHLAISTMSIQNVVFGLKFQFIIQFIKLGSNSDTTTVLNISREGINKFSYSRGESDSTISDLTLDDIMMVIEALEGWKLVDCNIGGF